MILEIPRESSYWAWSLLQKPAHGMYILEASCIQRVVDKETINQWQIRLSYESFTFHFINYKVDLINRLLEKAIDKLWKH
jgi:hypothetical protein